MAKKYMVGIDLGTGACKALIVDPKGEVLGSASQEYPTLYPYPGWSEQESNDWYKAFQITLKRAMLEARVRKEDICSIAIDGVTHNFVLLGEADNLLRPAIIFTDQRSIKQVEQLRERGGERIFKIAYHEVSPIWTLPQLLWIKENEPQVWERIAKILFTKDYLRYRLTGVYVTDWIDALGSLMFDAKERRWSKELCDLIEFPVTKLPPVVSPTTVVGGITKKAAEEVGLAEGTPVVAGTTDTAAEVYGTGAIALGQSTVKLATVGRICVVSDEARPHPRILTYYHVISGKWYPGTGTKACASSHRWFRDVFCKEEIEAATRSGYSVYKLMDERAREVPVGSEGLLFHPYLLGELSPYNDPYLKGDFVGITMRHKKEHFIRAVLEGTAFSLQDSRLLIQEVGLPMEEVRIIGGGAKSPIWRQIVCDVFGTEVLRPAVDDAAFGTALLGGVGVGIFKDEEEAVRKCVKIVASTKPDMKNHEKYQKLFQIYKKVHDDLAETYKLLSAICTDF